MLNAAPLSVARQPRGIVQVTGRDASGNLMPAFKMIGWESWEVNNNIYYEADTFRVCFAVGALPVAYNEAWWSNQQEIFIEIFGGFPADAERYGANDLQSLTYGRVDDVIFYPIARILEVSGRDLTAQLIDTKTTEKFQNLTASQIAINIAARHGLKPVVTATKTKVGKYYQIDQNRLNDQRSEWDMLTGLAQQEQFVVYVKGHELHFEPEPAASKNPYVLRWAPPANENGAYSLNAISMSFSRALNLARGVVVTVQSISPKTGKAVKAIFPQKAATIRPGKAVPQAQAYSYQFANLTYEKALQKAQQIHRDISRHEVKFQASLPADNVLGVTTPVQVVGTQTSFDQVYYPESITRTMSINEGYLMQVEGKNTSPQSVVPL